MRNYAVAAVLSLWVAILALSVLVFRELGWTKIKKYFLTVTVLVLCLLAVPGAGLLKIAMPYKDKILARIISHHSPVIELSAGCSIFPPNNIWNVPVSGLPVDARSRDYIQSMGPDLPLHADFGRVGGIFYSVIDGTQSTTEVTFPDGGGESDAGPYKIPDGAPVETGPDGHVLVLDRGACKLYELFAAAQTGPQQWRAGSGAIFDLRANRLRPEGWTSADAAGLPILPGLVRHDEVKSGHILHALRFTTPRTRRAWVWPGRHLASRSSDPNFPAMGQRFRLRASFDISSFSPEAQVILTALKQFGMFLSDNGGPWFLTGASDTSWNRQTVADLANVKGADFEAVDSSGLMIDSNSAEARR